jgi:hypothetical protein
LLFGHVRLQGRGALNLARSLTWTPATIAREVGKVQHFTRIIRLRKRQTDAQEEARPLGAILSSLAAFIAAGAKPRTPLAKAIVLVLLIKLIAIAGIKVFMFPESTQLVVDATAMARAIGPSAPLR